MRRFYQGTRKPPSFVVVLGQNIGGKENTAVTYASLLGNVPSLWLPSPSSLPATPTLLRQPLTPRPMQEKVRFLNHILGLVL